MGIKICVVGCGEHSRVAHGSSYQKYKLLHKDTELLACCDIRQEAAREYAREFCFSRYYTDYHEMLQKESPDVVDIICPVHVTPVVTADIIKQGLHVIVEKPPAENLKEAEALLDVLKQSSVQCRIAFNRRFLPLTRQLNAAIAEIAPDDAVQAINYTMYRVNRANEDFSTTAIHGIDFVKFMAGADYAQIAFEYDTVEFRDKKTMNTYMDCKMKNDVRARLAFLPCTGSLSEKLEVFTAEYTFMLSIPVYGEGVRGRLEIFHLNNLVKSVDSADIGEGSEMFETGGFYHEITSFLDAVKLGRNHTEGLLESTLQSVEVAEYMRDQKLHYKG